MKRKRKQSGNSSARPEVSYIISAYNRPAYLGACLWSLAGQSHENFEVIVTDNGGPSARSEHKRIVASLRDKRFQHHVTAGKTKVSDCYWSAEWGAKKARGEWLCFPCDDCYYLPDFARRMLIAGASAQADVILAEFVIMGPEAAGGSGVYQRWTANPTKLVKSSFFIRASKFHGFSGKPQDDVPASADQVLGHELCRAKAKITICQGLTVIHN